MRSTAKGFIVSVLVCVASSGSSWAAVADHVFFIQIETIWDHQHTSGATVIDYRFEFEIDTDDSVQRVEVLTPGGLTFEILPLEGHYDPVTGAWTSYDYSEDGDTWEWEYDCSAETPTALHSQYGDGNYRITVVYDGGGWDQTFIWYGVPGTAQSLPQPTQEPVLTHPEHHASVAGPVTFGWEPCTDPAVRVLWIGAENEAIDEEIGPEGPLDKTATGWVPVALADGYWEGYLSFINGYHPMLDAGMVNADGIAYSVTKISEATMEFVVGRPWSVYEVWGGDQDFYGLPEWWRYYQDPGTHGYTLLGASEDGRSARFDGHYRYYVLVAHEPVRLNCVRGSDGSYCQGDFATLCVENWDGLAGPCDQQYADVGSEGCMPGVVRLINPGEAWHWLRIMTDQCPWADLSGDCYVGLADLAIVAEQWMTGIR